jgi:phosphoribosylglycinamide formyltransferase 1
MKNVAFLFSGRGSLTRSVQLGIAAAASLARLALVISNNPMARREALPLSDTTNFYALNHRNFPTRSAHEEALTELLEGHDIDLIVLGGYRRVFTNSFVEKYGKITMNTHPSLLPAFPGDGAQRMAIEAGVKITGATLHFINEKVDQGPIIAQAAVSISDNTTVDQLRQLIISEEERLITNAVSAFLDDRLSIEGNKVKISGIPSVLQPSLM